MGRNNRNRQRNHLSRKQSGKAARRARNAAAEHESPSPPPFQNVEETAELETIFETSVRLNNDNNNNDNHQHSQSGNTVSGGQAVAGTLRRSSRQRKPPSASSQNDETPVFAATPSKVPSQGLNNNSRLKPAPKPPPSSTTVMTRSRTAAAAQGSSSTPAAAAASSQPTTDLHNIPQPSDEDAIGVKTRRMRNAAAAVAPPAASQRQQQVVATVPRGPVEEAVAVGPVTRSMKSRLKDPPQSSTTAATTDSPPHPFQPAAARPAAAAAASGGTNNNSRAVATTDGRTWDSYAEFVMSISGNPEARKLIKGLLERVRDFLIRHKIFNNPIGDFHSSLIQEAADSLSGGIYGFLDEWGNEMEYVGETASFANRTKRHQEDKGRDPALCRKLVDIDRWPKAASDEFQNVHYRELLEIMTTNPNVHIIQRQFFKKLDRGLGALGAKKALWRLLIEAAVQGFYKTPGQVQEGIMFEPSVADLWYKTTKDAANKIRPLLRKISKYHRAKKLSTYAVMSWRPGHKNLSNTVLSTECATNGLNAKLSNAIDFPPVENPTPDQIFAKEKYRPEHKAGGRLEVKKMVQTAKAAPACLMLLDTNRMCFDEDDESEYRSVHECVETEGFEVKERFFDEDLTVFLDDSELRMILVHGPFCTSGTALDVPSTQQARRTLSLATATNVCRFVQGLPPLSPTDEHYNPINGILGVQILLKGLHLGGRQAAALFRDYVSGPEINALTASNMVKAPPNDPVCNNRRAETANERSTTRPLNKVMPHQVGSALSMMKRGEERDTVADIMQLQESDNPTRSTVSYRWTSAMKRRVVAGSELATELTEIRREHTHNSGNPNGRGVTAEELVVNNDAVAELLRDHSPPKRGVPGRPFWIKKDSKTPTNIEALRADHPTDTIFTALVLSGLKERTKPRSLTGGVNRNVKKTPLFHLLVGKDDDSIEEHGFVKVYFYLRPDSTE